MLGDEVDRGEKRADPMRRVARPANHLDPVNILHDRILHLPINAGKQRIIKGAAIQQARASGTGQP